MVPIQKIRVTIWNEFVHERENAHVARIYPEGIHGTLAQALRQHSDLEIRTATLQDADQGLACELLVNSDVLVYWGHAAHDAVREESVARIHQRVLEGMGFVALHSAHWSAALPEIRSVVVRARK